MSIGPHDALLLDHWGDRLNSALDATPYLFPVGIAGRLTRSKATITVAVAWVRP